MATDDSTTGLGCEAQLQQLLREIQLMQSFIASKGKTLPDETVKLTSELCTEVSRARIDDRATIEKTETPAPPAPEKRGELLARAILLHQQLAAIVAPATPISLAATEPRSKDWSIGTFFVNSVVTTMMVIAILSLATFLWAYGDGKQGGPSLTVSAAALGSAFYALFRAYRYVTDRTFDPQYNAVYLMRFILGVVAGTILGYFATDLLGADHVSFKTTTLALLGGFSAEAVNQLLVRISETLVTLVKGSGEDTVKAREKELTAAKRAEILRARQEAALKLQTLLQKAAQVGTDSSVVQDLQSVISDLSSTT